MGDLVFSVLMIFAGVITSFIIIEVFRWGYNKEKRGERTDWRARALRRPRGDSRDLCPPRCSQRPDS